MEFSGFEVSLGGIADPAEVVRRYDDIERILSGGRLPFKIQEEKTELGTFKSYIIQT